MKKYSLSETAKLLNMSRQWVWVLVRMNRIKAERIGYQYVVSEDEIQKIKSSQTSLNNN